VPFEDALKVVLESEAGRLLETLRDGSHRDERAQRWQTNPPQVRTRKHGRARQEDPVWEQERTAARNQVREDAAWERFMRAGRRELGLGK
jgi:hypothetical protein